MCSWRLSAVTAGVNHSSLVALQESQPEPHRKGQRGLTLYPDLKPDFAAPAGNKQKKKYPLILDTLSTLHARAPRPLLSQSYPLLILCYSNESHIRGLFVL